MVFMELLHIFFGFFAFRPRENGAQRPNLTVLSVIVYKL